MSCLSRTTSHGCGDSHRNEKMEAGGDLEDGDSDDANMKRRNSKRKKRRAPRLSFGVIEIFSLAVVTATVLGVIVIVVSQVRRHRLPDAKSLNLDGANEERHSNLNNMDMPLRRGVPCLELLPVTELEQLTLPLTLKGRQSAVETLIYGEGREFCRNEAVRDVYNLSAFVGDQTMKDRAKSYEVQPTMKVHCGFCDEENEFSINPRDREFMDECRIVVLTCTFGGGDDLYQPIGMTEASVAQVCYVAFWDQVTLGVQEAQGQVPDPETGKVGLWRVVIVQNLPFADQRRNGKIPKILNHRLFPKARYSIWVDSKSQFRRDPIGVIEALLLRPKAVFAISQHGARSCVFDEGKAIVQKNKAKPEEVRIQLDQYHSENFPVRALFDGQKALAEASVIVREHTPLTNLFMCNWFNEMARFTARDQLSFPYVLVKLQEMHLNMFQVCTRRALVNSIGHTGKKPKLLFSNQ